MHSLYGTRGRRALDSLVRGRPPLLAFDFDGTLSPLGNDPDQTRTLLANLTPLRSLARKLPIAILTGRSIKDVRGKLKFRPTYIVGNHGREGLGFSGAERAARIVRGWRQQLNARWATFADEPGVFVEDKSYSLSLHYRVGDDPVATRRRLRAEIARLEPAPRVIGGKFVLSLTVSGSAHKGTALTELMRRESGRPTLFVGDDVTDEDAFRVRRAKLLTVRVGSSRTSAADFYVRDLNAVTRALIWLDKNLPR